MSKTRNKGFTLIELIIVIVILVILIGVTIGGIYSYIFTSRLNTDRNNCEALKKAFQIATLDLHDASYANIALVFSSNTNNDSVIGYASIDRMSIDKSGDKWKLTRINRGDNTGQDAADAVGKAVGSVITNSSKDIISTKSRLNEKNYHFIFYAEFDENGNCCNTDVYLSSEHRSDCITKMINILSNKTDHYVRCGWYIDFERKQRVYGDIDSNGNPKITATRTLPN